MNISNIAAVVIKISHFEHISMWMVHGNENEWVDGMKRFVSLCVLAEENATRVKVREREKKRNGKFE